MARVALLDVNVLVALFDPAHIHHETAHDWFTSQHRHGWATCAVTENGFIRVVSNPRFSAEPFRAVAALELLRKFCASGGHEFWSDEISLRDEALFDLSAGGGHQQLTDLYLLGLARRRRGCLATFDRSIPLAAVRGARTETLAVIAPDS